MAGDTGRNDFSVCLNRNKKGFPFPGKLRMFSLNRNRCSHDMQIND